MRQTLRLLASVSHTATYLTPAAPTGLTGLLTHATPRSTLLYLYSSTLDRLKSLPESSVYRQSTEALTKHRMRIVENIKPSGLSEWQSRVSDLVDEHPDAFKRVPAIDGDGYNVVYYEPPPTEHNRTTDDRVNAEYKAKPQLEGPRYADEVSERGGELLRDRVGEEMSALRIEAEPALTSEQVGEVEEKIGAGLIEEVISVAKGERELVETMRESQVYVYPLYIHS